jgi:hypothetical protein
MIGMKTGVQLRTYVRRWQNICREITHAIQSSIDGGRSERESKCHVYKYERHTVRVFRTCSCSCVFDDVRLHVRGRHSTKWEGGSESDMFNSLEAIAESDTPKTPVLNCRISRALEPHNVSDAVRNQSINIKHFNHEYHLVHDKSSQLGCTKFSRRLSSSHVSVHAMANRQV